MPAPDPTPVIDLIEAFRRSKTMFTAVSMGVFDRLHEAPDRAADLAAALNVNADALARLLDGCAALGLLRKQDGVYTIETMAEHYLCASSPDSLCGYIRYSDEALYPMWAHLADAVRDATPRWNQTFGLEGSIFSGFYRSDDAMRDFLRGMHGFGRLTSPRVVAAFDLSRFRRLVDLGGATGHLAIAACEHYPDLRAVVFDLPRVAALARETISQCAVHDRIEVTEGDFFTGELPQADLYALGRILHDWSDDKIDALLRAIVRRLPSGGGLLVAEKLLAEDGIGPVSANMQSLNMLVIAEGRERSLSEYTRLLRAAGFAEVQGQKTGSALDAILAFKQTP
ncbi:MAG TPA: methyltransferase [Bryobacteraceae bacterium]|nr:methyltransferase [Bryobacteraceae bacterium]